MVVVVALICSILVFGYIYISYLVAKAPKEDVTSEYFKVRELTIWLKKGILEFRGQKMSAADVSLVDYTYSGGSSYISIYFDSLTTPVWSVATVGSVDVANTLVHKFTVAIKQAKEHVESAPSSELKTQ